MLLSIFRKEFIKTWLFALLCLFISWGMLAYISIDVFKSYTKIESSASLCLDIMTKDLIYYENFAYIPVLIGLVLGISQFFPEVSQKRLKLTFHLPVNNNLILLTMLGYGLLVLTLIFGIDILALHYYINQFLPQELTSRIILTMLPYFLAGVATYGFTSWVIVEPNRKKQLINTALAVGIIYLYYQNPYPEAYNGSIFLIVFVAFWVVELVKISATNFKRGF